MHGGIGEKLAAGVVFAMVATAVLLPGRQTVPVLGALTNFSTGTIAESEGRAA